MGPHIDFETLLTWVITPPKPIEIDEALLPIVGTSSASSVDLAPFKKIVATENKPTSSSVLDLLANPPPILQIDETSLLASSIYPDKIVITVALATGMREILAELKTTQNPLFPPTLQQFMKELLNNPSGVITKTDDSDPNHFELVKLKVGKLINALELYWAAQISASHEPPIIQNLISEDFRLPVQIAASRIEMVEEIMTVATNGVNKPLISLYSILKNVYPHRVDLKMKPKPWKILKQFWPK